MFTEICKILFLTIAIACAARATEECQFNEYSHRKVVSDYSAVIVEVSSLQGCLRYLKMNKETHKAVAYQASSGKCCSVLQDLEYSLETDQEWTAFEVRNEFVPSTLPTATPTLPTVPPTLPTVPPTLPTVPSTLPTVTSSFQSTTRRPLNGTEFSKGVCDYDSIYVPGNSIETLSVNSEFFDPCDNISAMSYDINMRCELQLTTDPGYSLQYLVIHATETFYDSLTLSYGNKSRTYSGGGIDVKNVSYNSMHVKWISNLGVDAFGFCLKVRSLIEFVPPTLPTAPPSFPSTTRRPPNGTEFSKGVCDYDSIYVPGNSTETLSVNSEFFDPCDNISAMSYDINMWCEVQLTTDPGYSLRYLVILATQANEDNLTMSYGNESITYSGRNADVKTVYYNSMHVNWSSNFFFNAFGFCLKVRSFLETEPTANIIGVCDLQEILVEPIMRSISVFSYDFEDCTDLSKLRSYTLNQRCISRIYSANNAAYYKYEVNYQTDDVEDVLMISNDIDSVFIYGNGTSSGVIEGPYLLLWWRTNFFRQGKGFCLKVRTYTPTADEENFNNAQIN